MNKIVKAGLVSLALALLTVIIMFLFHIGDRYVRENNYPEQASSGDELVLTEFYGFQPFTFGWPLEMGEIWSSAYFSNDATYDAKNIVLDLTIYFTVFFILSNVWYPVKLAINKNKKKK